MHAYVAHSLLGRRAIAVLMDDDSPPKKNEVFCFRLSDEERSEFAQAAAREERPISAWIRFHLKLAARRTH